MDNQGNVVWIRERKNSNPLQFHSGPESDASITPPCSPLLNGAGTLNWHGNPNPNQLAPVEKSRKASPKPPRRSRKLSLFSQFHFNSKSSSDDKHGKTRRISTPASPYAEKIQPDFNSFDSTSNCSSTSSLLSLQSLHSIPPGLSIDISPCPSSETSIQNICSTGVEKENAQIREIMLETLKIQFENVTEYKREICDKLGKNVCQWVKRRVEIMKESFGQTCKIVSVVYVGAVRDKGIEFASQAILDIERDNFTAVCYRNGHIFAMAGIMVVTLDC